MTKLGRPTRRTPEIVAEILERLADGETLLSICRDEHMPARSNVSLWVREDPEFQDKVARAREEGTHALIAEARDIADDGRNDYMQKFDKEGEAIGYFLNGEHVQRSKLRVEQRWREAEALAPKVYGKRQTITHAGGIDVNLTDDSDVLMAEIIEILATGRVKLPNGLQIVEAEDEDEDDDPHGVG